MKESQFLGVTWDFRHFSAKTRLSGLRRTWRLLAVCLGVLSFLLIASLSPAAAADGALDPSFNTGSGQYAGVQNIPEIRGQFTYPGGQTGGVNWPYNGYNLLFGTFYGVKVGDTYPPNNGGNSCIARLKADGTLDAEFNVNGLTNDQINGEIRAVYIYPHDHPDSTLRDKILIGGSFNTFSGYTNFARLKADGSIDTTFTQAIWWGGAVNSFGVQANGKILVGGYALNTNPNNGSSYQLIRLMPNGSLDPDYTPWSAPNAYIFGMKVYPSNDPTYANDVRIFCTYPKNDGLGGTYYELLLDSNAAQPSITTPPLGFIGNEMVDGPIYNMAQQIDGKFVICGQFKNVWDTTVIPAQWTSKNRVARLIHNSSAPTWTLDSGYDVLGGPGGAVTQISPMSSADDRMVLAGSFTGWNGNPRGGVVRLTTTGAEDTTFNSVSGVIGAGASDRIQRVNWKTDGTGGWVYGYFRTFNDQARGGIAGLDFNGNLTSSFSNVTAQGGWPGMVYSLATQSDGKIIIGGQFNGVDGKYRGSFARINPNGSLDPSFTTHLDGQVQSVAVQGDGKILVAGQFGECQGYPCTGLARLNPNGSLDTAFKPMLVGDDNSLNNVYHVVPLSNGQIMIAGDIYNNTGDSPVARLNSDGSLDADFWANVSNIPNPFPEAQWAWGTRLAVVGNNYVLAGGYSTGNFNASPGFLGRITDSGSIDTTFSPSTPVANFQTMDGQVNDMLLQPDGKIVVSGMFTHVLDGSVSPPARSAIARFSANGLLDTNFTPNIPLVSGANTLVIPAIARQPNGKILLEGNFLNSTGNNNYNYISSAVGRLNPNGSPDSTFSIGIPSGGWFYPQGGNSILCLPKGKALIGGVFNNYNVNNVNTPAFSLVRVFASSGFDPGILSLLLDN